MRSAIWALALKTATEPVGILPSIEHQGVRRESHGTLGKRLYNVSCGLRRIGEIHSKNKAALTAQTVIAGAPTPLTFSTQEELLMNEKCAALPKKKGEVLLNAKAKSEVRAINVTLKTTTNTMVS